jgi:hypothetical protein
MTMWRPTETVEEDVSDVLGIDPQSKRRRSRRWRDGLADQTVVQNLEHVRSYRTFERDLIGSVEPRSVIELELAHRLASLLWRLRRAARSKRACLSSRANFCPRAGKRRPTHPAKRKGLPPGRMAIAKGPARTDLPVHRRATASCRRPCTPHAHDGPAPSPNVSCTFAILTRPCLIA